MATAKSCSSRLPLLELEKLLSNELCDFDMCSKLSLKLSQHQVISKEVHGIFSSLDKDNVDTKLMVRFLLRQLWEKIESEDHTYFKFIEVLSELELHSLCEALAMSSNEASGSLNKRLLAKDIPILVGKLATVAYKWNEIGIAVCLPMSVLMECENRGSNVAKLNQIINEWITGEYEYAKQPTLSNLNKCLSGPVVGVPQISLSSNVLQNEQALVKCQEPVKFVIEYASGNCEIADGSSTLFEVRASIVEGVTYEWMKDSECLSDGEDYCGTCTDILVIKHTHQGMQGQYTCAVNRGQEKLVSQKTQLKVLYSQEKEYLIEKYTRQREVPKDSWPPVIADMFTNLVLVKQTRMQHNNYSYTIRGNIDDVIESKEKTDYDSVFGKYQSGSLVLVEGRPGSGKTTLVHNVVRDWAIREKTLKGAKLVFLIRLREIAKNCTELSKILEVIYCDSKLSDKIASNIKEVHGKGVCIILDGFDEYKERDVKDSIVYKISHMKCLSNAMVIVTSRPVASRELKELDIDKRRVEVIGFHQDEILQYVDKYPFNVESLDRNAFVLKIKSHFKLHPNLFHMCYLPVHAAMICYLFHDFQGNFPTTETQVYFEFTKSLILRKLHHKDDSIRIDAYDDIPLENKHNFYNLCRLAFEMTIQSKQVAKQSEILYLKDSSNDFLDLNLVNIDYFYSRGGRERVFSFLHLTLQEYLAAVHIARLPDSEQRKIIRQYGQSKSMYQTWLFYFGVVSKAEKLIELIKVFPFGYISTFIFQCAFESQLKSVYDYVKKSKVDKKLYLRNTSISPMDFIAMENVLGDDPALDTLDIQYCMFDKECGSKFLSLVVSKCKKHIKKLKLCECSITSQYVVNIMESLNRSSSIECIDLVDSGLSSDSLIALGNLIKDNHSLTELDISHNFLIGCEGIKALADALEGNTSLDTLRLSPCDITKDPSVITNLLESKNNIRVLKLKGSKDMKTGWEEYMIAFMKGLKLNTSIGVLNIRSLKFDVQNFMHMLSFNSNIKNITLIGCEVEGDCVLSDLNQNESLLSLHIHHTTFYTSSFYHGMSLMSKLKELEFSEVCISSENVSILANSISNLMYKLKELEFSEVCISSENVSILANTITSFPSPPIETVTFHDNKFSSNAIVSLSAGLKCTNLSTVKITGNDIGPEAVEAIVDLIKNNRSISELYLDKNRLGSDGTIALAWLRNCNLSYISLYNNNIGPEAGPAIADFITHNNSIKDVDVSNNKLGSDGIIKLAETLRNCDLYSMNLEGNSIGPEAGPAIADLITHNDSIKCVDVGHNKLGSDGIIKLAKTLRNCDLDLIRFYGNYIGPEAGPAIADLINNNRIKAIDLRRNFLGSEGARELAGMCKYCNLDLSDNNIDSDSKEAIELEEAIQLPTCATHELERNRSELEEVIQLPTCATHELERNRSELEEVIQLPTCATHELERNRSELEEVIQLQSSAQHRRRKCII